MKVERDTIELQNGENLSVDLHIILSSLFKFRWASVINSIGPWAVSIAPILGCETSSSSDLNQ